MHGRHPHGPVEAVLAGWHVLHCSFAVLILLEELHMRCAQGAVLWDRKW